MECCMHLMLKTGKEEWGFVPPFIAAKLPVIINREYDGKVGVK